MVKTTLKFSGSDALADALLTKSKGEAVRKIVKKDMALLNKTTKDIMTSVYIHTDKNGKPYSKGENARKTQFTISSDGFSGTQTTNTDHIIYTEYGTRYMAAEPAIRPAFERTKRIFKSDLEGLIK